jgi:hypothetical protein
MKVYHDLRGISQKCEYACINEHFDLMTRHNMSK